MIFLVCWLTNNQCLLFTFIKINNKPFASHSNSWQIDNIDTSYKMKLTDDNEQNPIFQVLNLEINKYNSTEDFELSEWFNRVKLNRSDTYINLKNNVNSYYDRELQIYRNIIYLIQNGYKRTLRTWRRVLPDNTPRQLRPCV